MRKMNKMENKLRLPYASPGQAEKILDLLGRITPAKIDAAFIVDSGIATAPNAFKVIDFLKWLRFIDENNNPIKERINKLRLEGEEKEKFMEETIKEAYKDLFENVDVQKAKKEDIINFFISHYNFGKAQAKFATSLFLYLCQKFSIPVSKDLERKPYRRQNRRPKKTNHEIEIEEKIVRGEGIIISIRGENISINQKFNNKEEFEGFMKDKWPKIEEAIKIFLPEKKINEKNHAQ